MRELSQPEDARLLTGKGDNEDAAVLSFPAGKALVQTVDFFTPVVNDPYHFGQIAAANSLSDVYAMGGVPYAAMNIVCFPRKALSLDVLKDILRGGLSKILEAGAVMAGGHSVEDAEVKYGLSVSGVVDPAAFAANRGLCPGDRLVLTKPIGTGVLATAIKGRAQGWEELEDAVWQVASRLNAVAGGLIRELGLKAATDITGFGLGGHALEMSKASGWAVEIDVAAVPLLPGTADMACKGFFPGGSRNNRAYFAPLTTCAPGADPLLADLAFDAQTSGGLLLAVPPDLLDSCLTRLENAGETAAVVGKVLDKQTDAGELLLV